MLQYYARFLPNISIIFNPLNELLQKNKHWKWTAQCETAFKLAKEQLLSANVLTHYNLKMPIRLACSYGLRALISQVLPDGQETLIAFASIILYVSEKHDADIESEAISLIFGVKKFHKYLYGRKYTLVTDHKPLTAILGSKSDVLTLAAARMQRLALI